MNTEIAQAPPSRKNDAPIPGRVEVLAAKLVRDRNRAPHRHRRRRLLLWAALLVLPVAAFWTWRAFRPLPVEVTVVTYQRAGPAARPVLRTSGYVTYPRTATVAAVAQTPVIRLAVTEGQHVREGEVLAVFDAGELEAQKAAGEVDLLDAEQTFTRMRTLNDIGAASDADLQHAETALAAARARLDLTRARVDRTIVRAPFAGRVVELLVSVGEVASRGVCTLIEDAVTLIEVDVNQDDLKRIGPQQPAVVVLDAYPEIEYAARLYKSGAAADRTTNTVAMRVHVPAPDERFMPQLSARVWFVDHALETNRPVQTVLAVDTAAVAYEGATPYVWQVRDGRAQRTEVRLGESLEDRVEVVEGLQPDAVVVVDPARYGLQESRRLDIGS